MASKIILGRKRQWIDRARSYKVLMDGELITSIGSGQVEEFEVASGKHIIECKVSWYSSNKYEVVLENGEMVYLHVKNNMKGTSVIYLVLIIYIFLLLVFPDLIHDIGIDPRWLRFGLPSLFLIHFFYYATLGRQDYLCLEKDVSNVFAS